MAANQNQPPVRWLRLPSIARPLPSQIPAAAPPPPPPPQSRPALPVPTIMQPPAPAQPQEPSATAGGSAPAPPPPPDSPIRTSSGFPFNTPSSVPSSPNKPRIPASTSSVPSSPIPKPNLTTSVPSSPIPKPTTIEAAPAPAPFTTEPPAAQNRTPPQSWPKRITPPPSPLTLPPTQMKPEPSIPLEADQKTVVLQKTIDKPNAQPERGFTENLKSGIANLAKHEGSSNRGKAAAAHNHHHQKKLSSDSDDSGIRVITIAGDNRGAFMEVINSPRGHKSAFEGNPHSLHKKSAATSNSSSSGEEEGEKQKNKKERSLNGKSNRDSLPTATFTNSNVQGINNSIVFNSKCTHNDPGVHLIYSRKPKGPIFHEKEQKNSAGN